MKITHVYKQPSLNVIVIDDAVPDAVLKACAEQCPDPQNPSASTLKTSAFEIGEDLGKKWNTPANESYLSQGVLVNQAQTPSFFISAGWTRLVQQLIGNERISPQTWQYRSHTGESNGVWLHTDKMPFRAALALLYVHNSALKRTNGGLLLYSPTKPNYNLPLYKGYVSHRPINELLLKHEELRTDTIGGDYPRGDATYTLVDRIEPKSNRLVLMSHLNGEANIHAVEPCVGSRQLIQQWWHFA